MFSLKVLETNSKHGTLIWKLIGTWRIVFQSHQKWVGGSMRHLTHLDFCGPCPAITLISQPFATRELIFPAGTSRNRKPLVGFPYLSAHFHSIRGIMWIHEQKSCIHEQKSCYSDDPLPNEFPYSSICSHRDCNVVDASQLGMVKYNLSMVMTGGWFMALF